MLVLSYIALAAALLPLTMALVNLAFFRRLPSIRNGYDASRARPKVSVLIPARNEERSIGAAIESVLANEDVGLELIVLDDQSTDRTAAIVQNTAARDARVKLLRGGDLPPGWNGKQYACHTLARAASHDMLIWMDADVRLETDALGCMTAYLDKRNVSLLSGFPRQEVGGWMEKLIVPLIHVILLGYLPMPMMRWTRHPGFGAGCGQLFMARREDYERIGGHGAIRDSMHDGLTLPRAFREGGLATDIFDGGDVAVCRMYRTPAEVWWGFGKNAHEAMASPAGLPIWTLLLLGGHVLPWLLAFAALFAANAAGWPGVALGACAVALAFSALIAWRFGQPWLALVGRPAGVVILVAIQWFAFVRRLLGLPMVWKQRPHPA